MSCSAGREIMSPREVGKPLEPGTWGWPVGVVMRSGLEFCVSKNPEASWSLEVIGLLGLLPDDQML